MLAGLLLVGAFAGAVCELIWYPLRSFVALRTEARDLLTLHWDARKSTSPIDAITHYNEVGLHLLTFDQRHQVAAPLMGLLGYNPRRAGAALIAIAKEWSLNAAVSPDDEWRIIDRTLFPHRRRGTVVE